MEGFRSIYYQKTPLSYRLMGAASIYILFIVGGYSLFIFGPMMASGKSKGSRDSAHNLWILIIENQLLILMALLILGVFVVLLSFRRKKRPYVVQFRFDNSCLEVTTRKLYQTEKETNAIPLNHLRVIKKTYKTGVIMGRFDSLDIYCNSELIGHYFFDHFLWSGESLRKRELFRRLKPFLSGGGFDKREEVEFFK